MSSMMPDSLAQGRYQLGQSIGHGGMAEVYVALDTRLGRTVAVKVMRADFANDQIFLSRFRREAHAVAQMNNPNIVSIYDSGEEDIPTANGGTERVPYLVMEYVKGQTLRDIIKVNGALSQRDAEQVMLGVLNALEYSHRMGVIHRDIKPGNIMISEQGVVKVMDFGIARALDDSAATMTKSQGVVGTAQYLSPEQARGETVDMRSDLYSAGCVLYEMLTRPAAVHRRLRGGDRLPARLRGGDAAERRGAGPAEDVGFDLRQGDGQGPSEPVCHGGRVQERPADLHERRCAGGGRVQPADRSDQYEGTPAGRAGCGHGGAQPDRRGTGHAGVQPGHRPVRAGDCRRPARPGPSSAPRRPRPGASAKLIIGGVTAAVVAVIAIFCVWWFALRTPPVEMVTVPELSASLNETGICQAIEDAGLVCKTAKDTKSTEKEGTFTHADPDSGTSVPKGSTVTVYFSDGPDSTEVPDVSKPLAGRGQAAAGGGRAQGGVRHAHRGQPQGRTGPRHTHRPGRGHQR